MNHSVSYFVSTTLFIPYGRLENFHTRGDFTVSRSSQILPNYENMKLYTLPIIWDGRPQNLAHFYFPDPFQYSVMVDDHSRRFHYSVMFYDHFRRKKAKPFQRQSGMSGFCLAPYLLAFRLKTLPLSCKENSFAVAAVSKKQVDFTHTESLFT